MSTACRDSFMARLWPSAAAFLVCACGAADPVPDQPDELTVPLDAVQVLDPLGMVTRVVDVQPTGDGRVWVLDSTAPFFVVLGPDGQLERRFGEQGGGPGEFGRPWSLVTGPDSTGVWTHDIQRSVLIRISAGERRELRLPQDSIPRASLVSFKGAGINAAPPWLESTSDGFLMARARTTQLESALHLWNADILRLTGAGSEARVDLHLPLGDLLGDPATRFGDASVLLPYPLWTACPDGTVALYDPLQNTLRRITEEGEELDAVALPEGRGLRMTADLVFEMFYRQIAGDAPAGALPEMEEMRRLTGDSNQDFVSRSTEAFPEYSELRCTSDGTLWLRRFDPTTGRLGLGPDWLRVTAAGSTTLIRLPRDFTTFRIERRRMWGTMRDSLDVESVAWVELDPLG